MVYHPTVTMQRDVNGSVEGTMHQISLMVVLDEADFCSYRRLETGCTGLCFFCINSRDFDLRGLSLLLGHAECGMSRLADEANADGLSECNARV